MNPLVTNRDNEVSTCKEILDRIFYGRNDLKTSFRFWDGTEWLPARDSPKATIVFSNPSAFRSLFSSTSEVNAAEGYLFGEYDIEGDVEAVVSDAASLVERLPDLSRVVRTASALRSLPSRERKHQPSKGGFKLLGKKHSLMRDRGAIQYHYDVSNDFYKLWLDKNLVYSCAYFKSPLDTIDEAQMQKLDLICRKLRLKPGESLLDIGCGWGALVMHASKHYGVRATGVTLSEKQIDEASLRIQENGLQESCNVELRDYREIPDSKQFDKIVSVGMVEHVGHSHLPVYFSKAYSLLKPGGLFLNHGIAIVECQHRRKGDSFIDKYVFPDGELTPYHITATCAERAGFEIRDVENLREHYALTLRNWVSRLENSHLESLKHVSEMTYRTWRLYMAASAYGFDCGNLGLYQTLLLKKDSKGASGLPLTRRDLYIHD